MFFFPFYSQKQGGRLRKSVKRKEGCQEVEVREEKWLSEKKIEETETFYQFVVLLYLCKHCFMNLSFSDDLLQDKGLKIKARYIVSC